MWPWARETSANFFKHDIIQPIYISVSSLADKPETQSGIGSSAGETGRGEFEAVLLPGIG